MNKGFILKEYLLSLIILMLLVNTINDVSKIVFNYGFTDYKIHDELMIYKLRKDLGVAYEFNINDNVLSFIHAKEPKYLYYSNSKLILGPGVNVILDNVNDLVFNYNNEYISIEYMKNNKKYHRNISYDK